MIDGCSVLPYERNTLIPSFVARSVTATGTDDPPRPANGHHGQVLGREVRVVQQAGQEVGGAAGDAEALVAHEAEHLRPDPTRRPGARGARAAAASGRR